MSLFVDVALRAASIKKNIWLFLKLTIFIFVDVALRAASILKNHILYIFLISWRWQKTCVWYDLSFRSMLELLVLKNGVECMYYDHSKCMYYDHDSFWQGVQGRSPPVLQGAR